MRKALVMLIAVLMAAPAFAQERGGGRGDGSPRDSYAPRERQERDAYRRERMERREDRREHRFTREEREKLRQDILDANRDMRRRR